MQGLVLEGGSMRPIFSSGVMDALLDEGIEFPYVIGVSAGITDGVSYVSKQRHRNYDITVGFRNDKRYFGLRNFISDRSIFGIKFLFEDIPKSIVPFDFETYRSSNTKVLAGVTNALTGDAEYLDGDTLDERSDILVASCSQPVLFPARVINGVPYYDGGIADSIPAEKAVKDGCDKLLIVLTRQEGYKKGSFDPKLVFGGLAVKRKYPNLAKALYRRNDVYMKQIEYCEELERQGKAIILRPSEFEMISSFESDAKKLSRFYDHGYELAMSRMDEIKDLFKEGK